MSTEYVRAKYNLNAIRDSHYITVRQIERVVSFREDSPLQTLGPHFYPEEQTLVINAFLPRAVKAWISTEAFGGTKTYALQRLHAQGFYQAVLRSVKDIFPYRVGFVDPTGYSAEFQDPYAFGQIVTDYDLYLIGEGKHYRSFDKFGAHFGHFHDVEGVHFAVWAPNAASVSVAGNFNHWHPGAHPMTRIGKSQVWGLFIPGLQPGEVYKYALRSYADNQIHIKSDPYGFEAELRPQTASRVANLQTYTWNDSDWMQRRAPNSWQEAPLSIYEVHLGSWKRDGQRGWGFLSYRDLAQQLVEYVKNQGYTHIELLPVMEHPLDDSWGYQVVSYFAPTSRFGSAQDFMYFVDHCHQNGIGVILDWVPAHFPKDMHGLNLFDGTQIYAYPDPKKGEHHDWGTLIFDYGRNEVRNFLISNALFWLETYHADGLRVDAVASMLYLDYSRRAGEWVPNAYGGRENLEAIEFLREMNRVVHAQFPGVLTLAEESTAWPGVTRSTEDGGLGFSLKWNMGWMNDTLVYFGKDPVHRKHHQGSLTFALLYAFSERFILPISHDEVVHGKRSLLEKMPGDDWQKFANLRLALGLMFGQPGKKLLFMGSEFGQRREWDCHISLDWHLLNEAAHRQIQCYVHDLHALYRSHRAAYELDFDWRGFDWIDFSDSDNSIISFVRWSKDYSQILLYAFNMTPVPRGSYRLGVPKAGVYREVLNSDAHEYGGSGMGNLGKVESERLPWHHQPHSLQVTLPPLAVVVLCWNDD